jgi:hypothetical protein
VDPGAIREVQEAVRFFTAHPQVFRLRSGGVEQVGRYVTSNIVTSRRRLAPVDGARAFWFALRYRDLYAEVRAGVRHTGSVLAELTDLARDLLVLDPPEIVRQVAERMLSLCEHCRVSSHEEWPPAVRRNDRRLRVEMRTELEDLLGCVGELDALRAMGRATAKHGWVMPEIVDGEDFVFEADEIRHPFVEDAVGNPIDLGGGEPMVFLTGPNMAGKTTYLRSAALLVLLAQMGMGVPAGRARLTPVEVLLTSLNPSDNLRAGLSFFFAEVLRVKEAARHLAEGRRCFVLFDEVFKGTNVRDALEASASVILGFSKARQSGFIFSSHLVELVETLEAERRIRFHYFDGRVVDGKARYSYRMRPGVSDDRLGLHLLAEADIPDLIARIAAA